MMMMMMMMIMGVLINIHGLITTNIACFSRMSGRSSRIVLLDGTTWNFHIHVSDVIFVIIIMYSINIHCDVNLLVIIIYPMDIPCDVILLIITIYPTNIRCT